MAADLTPELITRPYRAADRESVFRIAADTAFFGEPVEAFLEDRRLFCAAVYSYYVDFEPAHAWVAVSGLEVAGFLVGCVDTRSRDRVVLQRIMPALTLSLLRGGYRLGRRTWRYLAATARAAARREFPHVSLTSYPAHLHINLAAPWRGRGAGRSLIAAYLAQLRSLGAPGVHLRTTSLNHAALGLYARTGLRLLASRPTHLWAGLVDGPVENLCFGLELTRG